MITLENVDELFTYHKWSPEQVERGNAIRAAAKELSRAILLSAPPSLEHNAFSEIAAARRIAALEIVNDAVMKANSAITFEAANLEPIAPADAHSERVAS